MLRKTGICVLSFDSGDSNLSSTLHSAISRYSAVSALHYTYHIQLKWKTPRQLTITEEHAASS
ncbi:hypothetical protein J6590_101642 [Homalodisca vitripennis]|nr:hypothetical protein J6590_101642 [Homalodisca vitripennis]